VLGIVIVFRDYLLAYLVQPIAQLGWLLWRIIASVDQYIYWVGLIILSSIFIIRFVLWREGDDAPSAYPEFSLPPSRIEFWQALIENAALDRSAKQELNKNLIRLLHDGHDEQDDLDRVIPHEILIKIQGETGSPLMILIPNWFRKIAGKFFDTDHRKLELMLTHLEKELELDYE